MKIGTLSFERRGDSMALLAESRREIIAGVCQRHAPDLLLCAGHSLDSNTDLQMLADDKRVVGGATAVIVEVKTDSTLQSARAAGQLASEASLHRVYLIQLCGHVRSLGHQVIIQSYQLEGGRKEHLHQLFEKLIDEKTASIEGRKIFSLCCGEINVLQGRKEVRARFPAAERALLDADIVANPTHDRMGNAGTLIQKRKWLSRDLNGRRRAYVSASNWNSVAANGRSQNPASRTLHTVYVAGVEQPMTAHPDLLKGYVYRECDVRL